MRKLLITEGYELLRVFCILRRDHVYGDIDAQYCRAYVLATDDQFVHSILYGAGGHIEDSGLAPVTGNIFTSCVQAPPGFRRRVPPSAARS